MPRTWITIAVLLCAACTVSDASTTNGGDSTDARPAVALRSRAGDSLASGDASPAPAPPSLGAVEYYPAALLARVGDSLARGTTTGHTLGARPAYQYIQLNRHASGEPEVHDRWTDVAIVQSGRATLLSGGRATGQRLLSGGEHRGGTITGGTTRPIGAGDLMVIRAGTPHQYLIARGDSLRYITIKVAEAPGGR